MAGSSKGSDTYRIIWETVSRIPKGNVATYGQIAALSRLPGQARLVGYALHNLPHSSDVPWHRVLNAGGYISFPQMSAAYKEQRALLEEEGIVFRNNRADFKRCRWKKTARLQPRRRNRDHS